MSGEMSESSLRRVLLSWANTFGTPEAGWRNRIMEGAVSNVERERKHMAGQVDWAYSLVKLAHEEALTAAQRERLARLATAGAGRPWCLLARRILYWLGNRLVAWGESLRAQASQPCCQAPLQAIDQCP